MEHQARQAPFDMQLERDGKGKITRKQERVAGGETREYAYRYDEGGRLVGVDTGYGEAETYEYDGQGRRIEAQLTEPEFHAVRLHYQDDRLVGINNSMVLHDDNGFRMYREQQHGPKEHYNYSPDYRLLRVEKDDRVIDFDHDENGQRVAKFIDGQLVEQYRWHDMVRMDAAVMHGVLVDFLYVWDDAAYGGVSGRAETQSRASRGTGAIDVQKKPRRGLRPSIMLYGDDFYHLYYDQVGSLRVVADEDGNVIKEIVYDSFGRILEDSNPAMLVPLGFAGGLHDRDTGWVRMGWRDYDPETGRFTALDPIGYEGGDSDLYGYCLDDPVNLVDPLGLKGKGIWGSFADWLVPEAEAASLTTDMDNNSTTFDPRPEDPDSEPFTIETRNRVTWDSKPGADNPFKTNDVSVKHLDPSKSYGSKGAYIETNDPRGRDIHGGGGANKQEALRDRQGWRPTKGCTRGQNEDVIKLGQQIEDFKKRHPGVKIPYERKNGER